jgi:hypothetical protein
MIVAFDPRDELPHLAVVAQLEFGFRTPAIIAADNNVIQTAFNFHARFAGHGPRMLLPSQVFVNANFAWMRLLLNAQTFAEVAQGLRATQIAELQG